MAEIDTAKAVSQSPEKKQEKIIAELRNGKVNFKQKPMSLEKLSETLQEIVKFRAMIERRIEEQESPLQGIPDEYLPLIAKLGHESDKTLPALAKIMQQELIPPQEEDEGDTKSISARSILPTQVVEQAIKFTLTRNNYGIEAPNGGKAPAAVCVWRWEVKDDHRDWLPKSVREKADARLSERVQAKEHLRQLFEALGQSERDAILDPKGSNRSAAKDSSNKPLEHPLAARSDNERNTTPLKSPSKKVQDDENQHLNSPNDISSRAKKSKDPEKAAKEKERMEKKAAKAEKDRRAKDAENKSRNLMASFFSKPKASAIPSSKDRESSAGPSSIQTDFERTFKPFVPRKGAILAPSNWFKASKMRKGKEIAGIRDSNVIVIDSDHEDGGNGEDATMQDAFVSSSDVSSLTVQERLQNILDSLPPPADLSRVSRHKQKGPGSQFKVYNPRSIRDLVTKLAEAEITGDDNEVRTLLNQLQDRDLYPAKVFIYHEDARPGYFGTWTRSSKTIGPRKPLAKDLIEFDYSYDSGAEWEEEPMGDADDVLQDDEEEGDSDEADSDLDSWLVDDDEDPETLYGHMRDLSPLVLPDVPTMPPPPPPRPAPKRKADDPEKKPKKRKVVVPLVPFAKGPCWEARIGESEYEPFDQYRIQVFNDTPFPVNPFTFVSTCVEDYKASLKSSASSQAAAQPTFAVPSLPEPFTASTVNSSSSSSIPSTIKKPVAHVKNPFPDAHLPFLLNRITELQMASFMLLVETIYQELKVHKVKKNAIEAKVREVGEKCKEKKVWIIKPALKAQLMQS